MLEQWLRSYHPEELFDENGKLIPELKALARPASTASAQTRTPTAVCSCTSCACRISAITD